MQSQKLTYDLKNTSFLVNSLDKEKYLPFLFLVEKKHYLYKFYIFL